MKKLALLALLALAACAVQEEGNGQAQNPEVTQTPPSRAN